LDALKNEAEKLMIPPEKQLDYVTVQMSKETENLILLEKKDGEKLVLQEKKDGEKLVLLEKKESEKQLQYDQLKLNITKTGLLWKLKTQTQRHDLEMFLFDCWERIQNISQSEIDQIRLEIQEFPKCPSNVTVSNTHCDL